MTKDPQNSNNLFGRRSEPVRFSERFTNSAQFKTIFDEGMSLVEETANYLDGQGRAESRELPRLASLAYATESMRLTTRLMQLASWLLLQRAVNEGELTPDEARSEKHKVRLRTISNKAASAEYEQLPENLLSLIDRSFKLHTRIVSIDRMIAADCDGAESNVENGARTQLDKLVNAFGATTESPTD